MTRFAILLGGDLTVTPRLKSQIRGARVIAADSGMMHAAALHLVPELWVGDFDSAGSELTMQYREVPRETFPAEKDATDGAIAVDAALSRGATEIVLLGGLIFVYCVIAAWALCHIFSGRGAYIHFGAMLGTIGYAPYEQLIPGHTYEFDARIRWNAFPNGKDVHSTFTVEPAEEDTTIYMTPTTNIRPIR